MKRIVALQNLIHNRLVRAIQRDKGLRRSIHREKPIKLVAGGPANNSMLVIDEMAKIVEMSIWRGRKVDD